MRPEPPPASSRLPLWVATAGGVGFVPVIPGTFGSLPGIALAWLLLANGGTPALLAGFACVVALGLWSAGRAARALGREDPGPVVVDEVAGQMLTLAFLPPTLPVLLAAFFLFRAFDVVKPPPARQLEALPGSLGIMADDVMAGLYANLTLHAACWAFPILLRGR